MIARLPQVRSFIARPRSIAMIVAMLVALVGAASPALAQNTSTNDLSPYETTPPTQSTQAPPPPAETTTQGTTTPAPEDSGEKGDQATQENAPATQPAQTGAAPTQSTQPAASTGSTGSTGSPARLAFTGGEPFLIAMIGAVLLLSAAMVHRRRRLT